MNEVVRFRIARAPQRAIVAQEAQLNLTDGPTLQSWFNGDEPISNFAEKYIAELGLSPQSRRFSHPEPNIADILVTVRWLDDFLVKHDNRIAWQDIEQSFNRYKDNGEAVVYLRGQPEWLLLREALSLALVAATVTVVTTALRNDILRLLLVMGLLEIWRDPREPAQDAEGVFAALRWRVVLLPYRLLNAIGVRRSLLARHPGVSDLYMVREEWASFELGEIAHIENVLKGELKERLLERTDEQETTITTDKEINRLDERDTQTTDRLELKHETERDTSLAFHIDGKVETSGQYGPTHVDTHLGAAFDYSVKEAERRAVTQARETVARAVSKIEERVREQRVARTLTRVRSSDTHALDNKLGTDNVVGIYRWVDKIKTVQVFKYPHRLLFEFEVPEPGAFIRWRPKAGAGRPPMPFTLDGKEEKNISIPLTPDLITATNESDKINYLELAQRYAVQGLSGPPDEKMVFADIANTKPELDASTGDPPVFSSTTTSVPDGYEGYKFTVYAVASSSKLGDGPNQASVGLFQIAVGTDFPNYHDNNDPNSVMVFSALSNMIDPTANTFSRMKTMNFRTPVTGEKIPIHLISDNTRGLVATVQIFCRPTEAKMREWRFATFDLIQGAYWELRRQHEQAAAQAAIQSGITIEGSSPARNAEVMREEIKRAVVELLIGSESGSNFEGRSAMTPETETAPARIDLDKVATTAAEIQFLEQAFEWENMSFVLYPYFWACAEKWAELQGIESADADFDRFLRSGSARVVLPARPGFELPAHLYTLFGTLWGGGPAPAPEDELYLSVADEVRAQQQPPKDGEPCEYWTVRLPTTLVYLSPLGTALPLKNDKAELPKKVKV